MSINKGRTSGLLGGASLLGVSAVLMAGSAAAQSTPAAPPAPAQQSQVPGGDATPGSTKPSAPTAPADAVTQPAGAASADATAVGEIVVTGTRLSNGMRTPTPVTVVSQAQLAESAPNNISDALAKLPEFSGSISTNTPASNASTGTIGQNLLNLRGLGDNRNLVLLDGRRVVATNTDFAVDINTLPQNLVARVDTVTGGASAAYGSDAVAGVVNFVLDTKFTGFKAEATAGVSTYDDLPSQQYSGAYGGSFLDDRLHVVASALYFQRDGLAARADNPRTWYTRAAGLIPNVLSASPTNIIVPDIRSSIGTDGGLITSATNTAGATTTVGGLKGTEFLANGATAAFNPGFDSGTGFQSGGDGSRVNFGFTPEQWRTSEFIHGTFDITPHIQAFGEFGYSYSHTNDENGSQGFTGSTYNFTVFSGNPYLPTAIQNTMTANNLASFKLGRYLADFPEFAIVTNSRVFREAVGLKGDNLFGKPNWTWEVSYSGGQTRQYLAETGVANLHNIYAAADAVRNPQTGQIVCRSQFYTGNTFVAAGTGLDPGCVPLNLLGTGTASAAAINYTTGVSSKVLTLHEDVVSGKVAGDFGGFNLGAGPISFATGFEYRSDSADQTADAISGSAVTANGVRGIPNALIGKIGGYRFFDPLPFSGSQDVKEGFIELGVPILKDRPFIDSLTADVAGRYTSYSLAGDVQTWKAGLEYAPVHDIRFRGTVSRDIRAPDLLELFNSAVQNSNNVLYPSSTRGVTTQSLQTTIGNPNLAPEKALTQTYGAVFTPSFLRGLSLSIDYYQIRLKGAIATLTAQNVVDFCAAGQTAYCSLIDASSGTVKITLQPQNLSVLLNEGIDFEADYNRPLFGNPLGIRLLLNHGLENYSQAPGAARLQVLDSATSPDWKGQLQLSYRINKVSFFVAERYISSVKMDPNQIQGVYTNDNHVPAVFYTDATITYDFTALHRNAELFVTVENLFNRDPPIDVIPPSSTSSPTNAAYDRIGRYITGGVRLRF